jgi:hypothetical protein
MKNNSSFKLAAIFMAALALGGCTPKVRIICPADGETFAVGQEITLTGAASDFLTANISEDLLSWEIDGASAGTGATIRKSDLPAGSHTITLTVRDRHGGSDGVCEISINVTGQSATTTTISGGADGVNGPQQFTRMLAMRDGVRLATDCFVPAGGAPAPVVLVRTVYGRTDSKYAQIANNLRQGDICLVVQDTRGRFGSEGDDRVFLDDAWGERQDGADTVAWLMQQPWCNGRIATMGGSALGITQVLMAPATGNIAGQSIWVACAACYDLAFNGGVWRKSLAEWWTIAQGNAYILPTWRQHPMPDTFWDQLNAKDRAADVTAPAIHFGGWWDIVQKGTIDNFVSRQYSGGPGARRNQFLVIGPWAHSIQQTYGIKLPDNYQFPQADLEWGLMLHWLKGSNPAVLNSPHVNYYVVGDLDNATAPGNVWRTADDWPPVATTPFQLYLAASGALITEPPADEASFAYIFDPANPCPTLGGANLAVTFGPYDQRPVSTRSDVVKFATEPLTVPLEATGPISVRLFVSTSAVDTDFTAKLVDIYPDGKEILLTDGIQRLKYRTGSPTPSYVTPGDVAELTVDLWSFSIIFNTGHRIGLQISSSNYPRFEVNPNTGGDFADVNTDAIPATNKIWVGPGHPSALILPVPAG